MLDFTFDKDGERHARAARIMVKVPNGRIVNLDHVQHIYGSDTGGTAMDVGCRYQPNRKFVWTRRVSPTSEDH